MAVEKDVGSSPGPMVSADAATPESAAIGPNMAYCPRCGIWRGHSSDCARHQDGDGNRGACDCTLAGGDPFRAALVAIRALCPAVDPGPARDPVWGDFYSFGNVDDVATDAANEALWEVAVICDQALGDGASSASTTDVSRAPGIDK